jgi:hypothetical protein
LSDSGAVSVYVRTALAATSVPKFSERGSFANNCLWQNWADSVERLERHLTGESGLSAILPESEHDGEKKSQQSPKKRRSDNLAERGQVFATQQ